MNYEISYAKFIYKVIYIIYFNWRRKFIIEMHINLSIVSFKIFLKKTLYSFFG